MAETGTADLTHMSRKVKEIIRAAGLSDELTFTSFRHGGFTEAADADLSDAEIRARHKSAVSVRYASAHSKLAGTRHVPGTSHCGQPQHCSSISQTFHHCAMVLSEHVDKLGWK